MAFAQEKSNTKFCIYQLIVRLFGNANPNPKLNGNKLENGCGTFKEINQAALNSIRDLGVESIWLTGILRHASQTNYSTSGIAPNHPSTVKGNAGSPYAITDFFDVDPDLSENPDDRWKEFNDCCKRIHSAEMKVLIDFIPNHTARQYRSEMAKSLGLRDLGEHDFTHEPFHPNNHYYYIPDQALKIPSEGDSDSETPFYEFPAKATGNDCFTAYPTTNDWYETVKLNYGRNFLSHQNFFDPTPATWNYMKEVLRFWAQKGIDGFRCDMVELVPIEFWSWVIPQIKSEFPHLIFIGEVYNPTLYQTFIHQGRFDYLYDKVGLYDEVRALIEGHGDANRITGIWQNQEGFEHKMLRFLENHDEQRIASPLVGKEATRALPGLVVSTMMGKGPFMIYFGQELGEKAEGTSGFSGDDGKTSIFDYTVVPTILKWNQKGKWNAQKLPESLKEIRQSYKKIIDFAQETKAIRSGLFFDLQYANQHNPAYNSRLIYSFIRYSGKEIFLIIASFSSEDQWVRIQIPAEAWYALGISSESLCRFEDVFEESTPVEFYVKSSFQSDGGSAGILIPVKSFGYPVLKMTPIS